MIRFGVGILALTLAVPLLALAAIMMSLGSIAQGLSNPLDPEPSEFALEDIPAVLLPHYREAARGCPGLPWTVLAGIGKVESNHGRFGGSEVGDNGDVSPPILGPLLDGSTRGTRVIRLGQGGSPWHSNRVFDRALGPMQFLTDTFRRFGLDGNGDGEANPHNALDAVHSAANYLCSTSEGESFDVSGAILTYNRSDVYVREVLDYASRYGVFTVYAGADPMVLLAHPNVSMGPAQEADLRAGIIDPQLIAILLSVAQNHQISISSLQTGHSLCIARTGTYPNCRISRHASGRAADIHILNGRPVSDSNQDSRRLVATWLLMDRNTDYLRPWTIGHPYGDLDGRAPGSFNDGDHEDHLHIAVNGTPTKP